MDKHIAEENCELLFEYLRSTLYDQNPQKVEEEKLAPEFRKLGKGIAYTQKLVEELLKYSEAISRGDLNPEQPSRDNLLCSNLKNLQSNLTHLTWQAKQVAKGDYTQHVSYLGEFSESFNEMIRQLKEREEAIRRRTALMEEYNRFFLEMSGKRDEWILITEEATREVLYCNRQKEQEDFSRSRCSDCVYRLDFAEEMLQRSEAAEYHQTEVGDGHGKYYEVSAFRMEWNEKKALAFLIRDITKFREQSDSLTRIAYNDALTGIRNRRYFDEFVQQPDLEKQWDLFCYLDLDGLKYVNDRYGHKEGDDYIQSFVTAIQGSFRATDELIRMGGDEFCMFCRNMSAEVLERKLEKIRAEFIAGTKKPYPVSFSYGIAENTGCREAFEETVKRADDRMYEYKKRNKKERK